MLDPDVEAAFLTVYGVDVEVIGLSMFARLLYRLPPGALPHSNTAMAWTFETHMLAALVDSVAWNTWAVIAVNSKKPPRKPKPIPRPGEQQKRSSWGDLARMIGGTDE